MICLEQLLTERVDPKFGDKGIVAEGTCSFEEVEKICFWASCRGQTLVRTIRGLFNYRYLNRYSKKTDYFDV